jgi:hypothetical protein
MSLALRTPPALAAAAAFGLGTVGVVVASCAVALGLRQVLVWGASR